MDYSFNLTQAMNQKYGQSKLQVTKTKYNCLYNLTGIQRELEANRFDDTWGEGKVKAVASTREQYDEHCKKEISQSFTYETVVPELINWEAKHITIDSSPKKNLKDL